MITEKLIFTSVCCFNDCLLFCWPTDYIFVHFFIHTLVLLLLRQMMGCMYC